MTDARPLRVGLVGAGAVAELAQLPVLAREESVTLAGVVTASPEESERVLRRWPVQRAYADVEHLLDDSSIDALFVLTPKHMHGAFVEAGLRAGVSVFCEKPLTTVLEESRRLVEIAEGSPGVLMVGLNRRFCEVYQRAHAVALEQPPAFVVGQKNRVGREYRATLENGVHMIDLLRWFCGEAVSVSAASVADDPYQETGVGALIGFDSGSTALFLASRAAGEWDERLEIYGDGVTIRVVAPDTVTVVRDGTSSEWHARTAAAGWPDLTVTAGFRGAIEHFLHCVRTGETPLTDGLEALRTQELTDRVLAAAGLPTHDRDAGAEPATSWVQDLSREEGLRRTLHGR
ncbi:Gfo/Idh/MocA family protein [Actinotalea caeni]|uniref:Gfo/Idh/MocA family protein n=1 Tax=Actinotalea caeni TaxID=1348467 RepID=UPI0012E255DC|nr:Gfo/Idh/MocA family oxidoreductase [Actinotalea caeni]